MASTITKTPPKVRPKHLNLFQIRQPLPAIMSIMHRISGAALFLFLPPLLWLLDRSLDTEIGYDTVKGYLSLVIVKIVLLGLLYGFMHHFCAGIRYLFLDLHKGIDLKSARLSAGLVYVFSIPMTLVAAWLLLF
jgi:succinate dehydrogenase / fumarate reductase cytochrome b subunit